MPKTLLVGLAPLTIYPSLPPSESKSIESRERLHRLGAVDDLSSALGNQDAAVLASHRS